MKKYLLIIFLTAISTKEILANHTKGGWMYYEYLGPGVNDPSKLRYRIGLNLYIDCASTLIESSWNFSFFNAGTNAFVQDVAVSAGSPTSISGCTSQSCYPCISGIPIRCYKIINYETIVELTPLPQGYIVSKQRCCRITGISNIQNSASVGATWTIKIPGTLTQQNGHQNWSPKFIFNDTAVVCGDNQFSIDFKATDHDGDSLAYFFCDAYSGGSTADANPGSASAPPYSTVPYSFPYTGAKPLGAFASINPVTGVISGKAPPSGEYVVCVCVFEYRNGVFIGESRKELHLKFAPCTPLVAKPDPKAVTCDGFTVNFSHSSSGANSVYWDFGDLAATNDTSLLDNPSYTYPDTGVYHLTFIINRGQQCTDTGRMDIKVYPGFFPGFINSQPLCTNVPIQFTDTTKTNYGIPTGWRWDFGDLAVLSDTSHFPNPTYTYPLAGTYNVEFIVGNSKGCIDTVYKDVIVLDPPPVNLFPRDTSYCGLDSLQLNASGIGNFSWTPTAFIIGANTATPVVFPPTQTKYIVTLNNSGCISKDSLVVTPKFDLTNSIAASNNPICEEDTITLTGASNYSNVTWQWNPVASVANSTAKVTQAFPITNTTYNLATTWGRNCVANASIPIVVRPLAVADAGPFASICEGQATVQLNASGGTTYQWTPTTGLSNPNIANPIASPGSTTTYRVSVGVAGCSKRRTDTTVVTVRALPPLTVPNDTLMCTIDTIQLNTTGVGNFVWTPNYMINNVNAQNPLVSPDVPTKYFVRLTDGFGCYSDDSVYVNVKAFVTLFAGNDTSLCRTDGFNLAIVSDGLHYNWTPSTYLDDPAKKSPFAIPLSTTMYHVVANIGKCQAEDSVLINVVPYPPANAGLDKALCPGFNTQLQASGGSNYVWSPATFLSNRFIANPTVINPTASIRYIVTVTDTLGCPKPVKDTVFVTVYPKAVADAGPRDTSIVEGQPLQLKATGGASYLWSPPQWLSALNIPNPVALPQATIEYIVEATTATGCKDTDSILVKLFKLDPDMYVPNVFTPNGDGLNDVIRPILLGMKELKYFKIYNRLGQMVFYTTDIGRGWDGKFGGRGQDPGNFVWVAEGVTYKGEVRQKKGNVILLRQ